MSDSIRSRSRLRRRGRFPWAAFRRWARMQAAVAAGVGLLAALGPHFYPKIGEISGPAGVLLFLAWTLVSGAQLLMPLGELLESDGNLDWGVEPRWADTEWDELHARLAGSESRIAHVREQSEAERRRLESWVSSISDAVLAVDSEGLPVFCNARFADWFGQGRLAVSDLAGAAPSARVPGLGELFRSLEVLGSFRAVLGRADFRDPKEAPPVRLRRIVSLPVSGEASQRVFDLGIEALLDAEGRIQGAVGVFHDITELKRTEQMRIDFVANASHELRTPLTSIKGYVDTLAQDVREDRFDTAPRFIDVIARNADRLMSLVNDLLDLSQLESGGISVERSRFPVAELTDRVLSQLEPLRELRRQRILREGENVWLVADAHRVEQVLLNLVSNAIKYAPEESEIRVGWHRDPAGGMIALKVADNGSGIPIEHQSRIFERFYRVDKARSREQGGTGLGLSIVKHIMQAHGGQVSLASEPGRGSEFTCRFPQDGLN